MPSYRSHNSRSPTVEGRRRTITDRARNTVESVAPISWHYVSQITTRGAQGFLWAMEHLSKMVIRSCSAENVPTMTGSASSRRPWRFLPLESRYTHQHISPDSLNVTEMELTSYARPNDGNKLRPTCPHAMPGTPRTRHEHTSSRAHTR